MQKFSGFIAVLAVCLSAPLAIITGLDLGLQASTDPIIKVVALVIGNYGKVQEACQSDASIQEYSDVMGVSYEYLKGRCESLPTLTTLLTNPVNYLADVKAALTSNSGEIKAFCSSDEKLQIAATKSGVSVADLKAGCALAP